MLLLIEATAPENVERFLEASPYAIAGLYESTSTDMLDLEVGTIA